MMHFFPNRHGIYFSLINLLLVIFLHSLYKRVYEICEIRCWSFFVVSLSFINEKKRQRIKMMALSYLNNF